MSLELYQFRCKTSDAYTFKMLIELFHNNIKTACFEITPQKLSLRMMDSNRRTLIDVVLLAEHFNLYYFSPIIESGVLHIGINLNHFFKMLKSIKKKDTLILFIQESQSHDLGIEITPKDYSRLTTSYVKIQNIQNLEIAVPDHYNSSILVQSNEFSKMCKDMFNMSNTILITAKKYSVGFMSNVGNVYSREVILGNTDQNSTDHNIIFQDEFDTEQLSRILKISNLSTTLSVHFGENVPILLSSKVGILGSIRIFVKSKRQIEEELNISDIL